MSEVYRGVTINTQGDAAPWGSTYNATIKSVVDIALSPEIERYVGYNFSGASIGDNLTQKFIGVTASVGTGALTLGAHSDRRIGDYGLMSILEATGAIPIYYWDASKLCYASATSVYDFDTELHFKAITIDADNSFFVGLSSAQFVGPSGCTVTDDLTLFSTTASVLGYGFDSTTDSIHLFGKTSGGPTTLTSLLDTGVSKLSDDTDYIFTASGVAGSATVTLSLTTATGTVVCSNIVSGSNVKIDGSDVSALLAVTKGSTSSVVPIFGAYKVKTIVS